MLKLIRIKCSDVKQDDGDMSSSLLRVTGSFATQLALQSDL